MSKFKYLYQDEDIDFIFKNGLCHIYLKLDSNNNVFRIKFKCDNEEVATILESICELSIDQNIDSLKTSNFEEIYKSRSSEYLIDLCILIYRKAIMQALSTTNDIVNLNHEQIICRCTQIDLDVLENLVIQKLGKTKEIIKESNMGMICGNCTLESKTYLDKLVQKQKLYEGHEFEYWKILLRDKLVDFSMYSPAEFANCEIEVKELRLPIIEIKILEKATTMLTKELAQKA